MNSTDRMYRICDTLGMGLIRLRPTHSSIEKLEKLLRLRILNTPRDYSHEGGAPVSSYVGARLARIEAHLGLTVPKPRRKVAPYFWLGIQAEPIQERMLFLSD